jgi:nicotinate-nucleotide pyrophosphorylase (carboxylating)
MINIKKFVKNAIVEDNGRGDLFFDIAPKGRFSARVVAKDDGILAGVKYAKVLGRTEKFDCKFLLRDGDEVKKGDVIAELEGKASILLSSERTFLNLLQHASGIATSAARYKALMGDSEVVLLDTRKTRPQLRDFEKYASRVGGAINHRLGLDDCLMLKDTHLKTIPDLKAFIVKARQRISWVTKIEIECETFDQAIEAMEAGGDIIMCDNMTPQQITEVSDYRKQHHPHVLLEASGNITEENIQGYLTSGIDAISSGSIIHQATWLDFSMKFD